MTDDAGFVADPRPDGMNRPDSVLVYDAAFNLVPAADQGLWWSLDGASKLADTGSLLPVGVFHGARVLALRVPETLEYALSLRTLFAELNPDERAAIGAARQRLQWVWDHGYCGRCGRETSWHDIEYTLYCANCHHRQYPRLSPCVIVAIEDGDRILLGRSHRHPVDLWSLIAGFIEPGESAEEAVAREVFEETGIGVRNVRYRASESWPFPHQFMLGFTADYAGGELRRAEDELAGLAWFAKQDLPRVPGDWTIAGRLIGLVTGAGGDE